MTKHYSKECRCLQAIESFNKQGESQMPKTRQYNNRTLYFSERINKAIKGVFDHPLTVIEAPMGYGKTTAVKGLLNTGVNVLWLTVYDGYASSFWSGFCKLFSELDDALALGLARLGLPNDSISRHEALNLIGLLQLLEKTVLVLDDYYLLDNSDIDTFIALLAQNEIKNLHVVITTRLAPFENLEELKLKGYVHHIQQEALELTPKEIARYYRLCGINLKTDEASKLYDYTEGWISALYLFMLTMKNDGEIDEKEPRVPMIPDIYSLMEKAVFNPLPDEIKDFMINVCIYDFFTVEQAEYIWPKQNASLLLDEIISRNVFVSYDLKSKTYRMHNILATFIKDILVRKDQVVKQGLYQRAAWWYMKTGNYLAAMHYCYLGRDFDKLLTAVEFDKGNSISIEQKNLFIKYYEDCPDDDKHNHPVALLIYAMLMFLFNEMERFTKTCSDLVNVLENADIRSAGHKNQLMGEFELLQSFTKYNDIMAMSQHHRKACALLKTPAMFLDTKDAWTMGSPSILYMFYRETGQLVHEVSILKETMPYYYQLTGGHGNGAEHIMEAEWHFNQGNIERAEISVHRVLSTGAGAQPEIVLCAMFLQMRIAMMKADFTSILNLLEQMHKDVHKQLYYLIHSAEMCEGFIYAGLKQSDKIPAWIAEGDFNSNRLLFPTIAFCNIIYGRILLLKGDNLKMIGLSEQFTAIASVFPNLLANIYTCIYAAAANARINNEKEALVLLEKALDMAVPDNLYMPFIENCDYIKPLLKQIHREGSYNDHINRILMLGDTYQKAVMQIISDYFTMEKPRLSEREKEIAALAANGLTNKEIAAQLFISENTVKTQLKSVFDKLGVKSRSLLRQHLP